MLSIGKVICFIAYLSPKFALFMMCCKGAMFYFIVPLWLFEKDMENEGTKKVG